MHGFVEPEGILYLLWETQEGKCFHCGEPMVFTRNGAYGLPKATLATREHLYPHRTSGRDLHNNIVLAHAKCNHARGCKEPTPDEITKAKAIYMILGLTPFVHNNEWMRAHSAEEGQKSRMCGDAKKRWDSFRPPTLAEIWPVACE